MGRLGFVVVLLASACHSHPKSNDSPSCRWHSRSERAIAEDYKPRCQANDPWCGPDALFYCLDDLDYRRNDPRRPIAGFRSIAGFAADSPAPRCSYDGQCAAIAGGCAPDVCEFIEPPKPSGHEGTSLENIFYVCGLNTAREARSHYQFCGCVDHACNWFVQ